LAVVKLEAGKPGSDWLTRLTPMNFYPLIAGVPDKARAEKVLAWMYREDKFWLPALLPTVAKDDPVWPEQGYWHGHVWAPANYLVWLGVKRYADGPHQAEYARRSVKLFMQNWNEKRLDCENYNSTDGTCGDEPHYCWGALLDLIGLEALADVGPDFKPVPRKDHAITEHIVARNVPFGGRLYRLEANRGTVTATEEAAK
jgi:putative isomerase